MIDDLEREGRAHRDISFTNILFVDFEEDPSVTFDGVPTSCIGSPSSDLTLSAAGANDPVPLPKGAPTMQDVEMRDPTVSVASVNDPVPVDGMAPPVSELEVKKLMITEMNRIRQCFKCRSAIVVDFDYAGFVNAADMKRPPQERTYSQGGRTVSKNPVLAEC